MTTETTRPPHQWCDEVGVLILDPDGWRADRKDFHEPITLTEFMRRLVICTIRIDNPATFAAYEERWKSGE